VLGVERSSVRYISHKPDQTPLVMRIRDLAATRTRFGYFRMYILLRGEGCVVNHKRVYRLDRDDGLSLRLKKPRRNVSAADRERQPAALAANEMWSMDYVSDGRRLRELTVVDALTREALAIEGDQGIKGEQVVEAMARILLIRGALRPFAWTMGLSSRWTSAEPASPPTFRSSSRSTVASATSA
jgi:putative transposase